MPKKILVTGGAGFIGSAVVRHLIGSTDATVINIDKLTYAGNLESLSSVDDSSRYHFEHVDICDAAAMKNVFAQYRPDARGLARRAGRRARVGWCRRPRRYSQLTSLRDRSARSTDARRRCLRADWRSRGVERPSREASSHDIAGDCTQGRGLSDLRP